MAVRTFPADIKEIMAGLDATDPVILSFITSASAVIDAVFASDTSIGSTLLKELERWLAAHLIASTIFRQAAEEKLGEADMKYVGKFGLGLDGTTYGQTVKVLDITGKIAKIGKSVATMFSVPSFNSK